MVRFRSALPYYRERSNISKTKQNTTSDVRSRMNTERYLWQAGSSSMNNMRFENRDNCKTLAKADGTKPVPPKMRVPRNICAVMGGPRFVAAWFCNWFNSQTLSRKLNSVAHSGLVSPSLDYRGGTAFGCLPPSVQYLSLQGIHTRELLKEVFRRRR